MEAIHYSTETKEKSEKEKSMLAVWFLAGAQE